MDILARVEDSLLETTGRRFYFCPRPKPEQPDDQGLLPTCPPASGDAGDSRIAPADRPTDPKYDTTTDKNDQQQQQHHEHDRQQQQQQADDTTARQYDPTDQNERPAGRPTDLTDQTDQNDRIQQEQQEENERMQQLQQNDRMTERPTDRLTPSKIIELFF